MPQGILTHGVNKKPDGRLEFYGRQPSYVALDDGVCGEDVGIWEAADRAGMLGWGVRAVPLTALVDGQWVEVPGKNVTVRGGEGTEYGGDPKAMGVVGTRYNPIDNEAWIGFTEDVLKVAGGRAVLEGIGAVGKVGATVFASLSMVDMDLKLPGDESGFASNLLIGSSHDGSAPLSLIPMVTRLWCCNQLRGLLGAASRRAYVVRHTAGGVLTDARVKEAQKALGIGEKYLTEIVKAADGLANEAVVDNEFDKIMARVFPELTVLWDGEARDDATVTKITRAENKINDLYGIWNGDTVAGAGIGGTAWGVLQTVGEYVDWYGTVKGGDSPEVVARATRDITGGTEVVKGRAYEAVKALVAAR